MLHRLLKNCIMENHRKLAGEPELKGLYREIGPAE